MLKGRGGDTDFEERIFNVDGVGASGTTVVVAGVSRAFDFFNRGWLVNERCLAFYHALKAESLGC